MGSKLKSKQTRRFDGKTLRLKTELDLLIVVKVRALERGRRWVSSVSQPLEHSQPLAVEAAKLESLWSSVTWNNS